MAYVVVVYIVMADVVVACVIMAYIVMAYVVLARMGGCIFRPHPSMLERGMFVSRNAVVPAGSGRQHAITSIGISASPTACPLRGEAVVLSTGTPIPVQWTCRRRCRDWWWQASPNGDRKCCTATACG